MKKARGIHPTGLFLQRRPFYSVDFNIPTSPILIGPLSPFLGHFRLFLRLLDANRPRMVHVVEG